MARLVYSATMSADGFIAAAGGDMSWLTRFMGGGDKAAAALVPQVGALLVGRRTYGGDDPNRGREDEEGPFGGAWQGPQFVVTHRPPAESPPDVHFHDDLARAIAAAKEAAGEKYVHVLGAEVARGCLELGELDEVLVLVAPILLGDGVRLFEHPGGAEVELERIGVEVEPIATHIWFRVVR
ncbi:MAG TPA: dihydrofolate reductase family protein [Solirubrobacterales bacterium]|jgi:dihydrofolate reductase|nr:dihydrofolate reductase family protein [Solirubrobacterales bacterium]